MGERQPSEVDEPALRAKPTLLTLAKKFFGTRHRRIVIGVTALIIVGGIVGASVLSAQAAADHAATVAAAQKREAEANKAREAAADKIREAKSALVAAKDAAAKSVDRSISAIAAATSFAEASALAAAVSAQDALTALFNGYRPATTSELATATENLDSAVTALGTAADAADRAYIAAETASGRSFTDNATVIRIARDLCKSLDSYYASDPSTAVDRFLDHQDSEDAIAVTAYCPQYLPAIKEVASMIPGDGGYAVAGTASAFGEYPTVLAAGAYATRGAVSDCYWEVNDTHGGIIRNNFILSAPGGVSVQLRVGQGFTTQGCGAWARR